MSRVVTFVQGSIPLSQGSPSFPSEEYIAGREHGRVAGLKRTLRVRLRRYAAGAILGGLFAAVMLSSPATTGRTSFYLPIAFVIFPAFIVLGILGCLRAVHSYRRSMSHLREDIVRSVMSPDDATPEPSRLRKWWMRSDSNGVNPWEQSAKDGANDYHRRY
jgi:hypothetical protein